MKKYDEYYHELRYSYYSALTTINAYQLFSCFVSTVTNFVVNDLGHLA